MDSLTQRKYYKLFTGTNQTGGTDKIYLGYEAKTTELVLKKGQTTYFHAPFFSKVQNISATTLGFDGAMSGPIPALADRIFKKRGNYENTTPWGPSTGKNDGTWLCSWYYALSTETPVWLDRYYDPGRLSYQEALEGLASFTDYTKSDPVYYDIPSTLNLEPGALYSFYHHDENNIHDIIDTFSGVDKSRLRLNIDDWSTEKDLDKSIFKNTVTIDNFTNSWVLSTTDPGYVDRYALSFDNNDFINCYATYNPNYNLQNEFTLTFWINHKKWSNATSTQLVGNLKRGGYGVFYNNLNYNPFFVIPETNYGHLFYSNQNFEVYTEKNAQASLTEPTKIQQVAINSNTEVIVADTTNNILLKYNHTGDVLTFSKDGQGGYFFFTGNFIQFVLDKDDNIIVYTTTNIYYFNKDLVITDIQTKVNSSTLCLTFDQQNNLIEEPSCLDIKFDYLNNKWHINTDKKLFKNNILVNSTSNENCTNIAIDPSNSLLWVLHGTNKVSQINILTNDIIKTFEVGINLPQMGKNISFIQTYDRSTNTFTWFAVIYYELDKTLYQISLDGRTIKAIYLPQKLNILDPVTALQDINFLQFNGKGDFTGYEHRRFINKILYDNKPQLQFKVSTEPGNQNLPNTIYTISASVDNFADDLWHLVTVTVKNNELRLYIDSSLRGVTSLSAADNLDFDYKNDLFIGTPCGKNSNFNKEINSTSVIWNGYIDSIKIYNYAFEPQFIRYLILDKIIFSDITWNIPTTAIQYIEGIDRMFKNRLPGHKSSYFNIKLIGTDIKDLSTRIRIERDLRLAIEQTKPGYSELLNIEWIE